MCISTKADTGPIRENFVQNRTFTNLVNKYSKLDPHAIKFHTNKGKLTKLNPLANDFRPNQIKKKQGTNNDFFLRQFKCGLSGLILVCIR